MNEFAIKVEGLGKRYRIGAQQQRYPTLREALVSSVKRLTTKRNSQVENNTIWALKDVSFEIKPGEVVGIIGRNGAGKSTLLKLLSHITEPTKGRVIIYGRVGSLLEVGTGFHPELTGRENIYLNGAILGMKRTEIDRKFDEIVAFAEIEKFLDTPVKRYSSGMYVRLAFAVAAHLEPDILLVDEVLAVGDNQFQKKCLGKMGEVAKGGRTVLFVSHQMASIQSLCVSGILLDEGKVVIIDEINKTIAHYFKRMDSDRSSNSITLSEVKRMLGLIPVFQQGWMDGVPLLGEHILEPFSSPTFEFILDIPQSMRRAWMGLYLENETGIRLIGANTRWTMQPINFDAGKHKIKCKLNTLALVPGRYYLSLGFSAEQRQIDQLERIALVEILSGDVYGTGQLPWPNQGYFLSDAKWDVDNL